FHITNQRQPILIKRKRLTVVKQGTRVSQALLVAGVQESAIKAKVFPAVRRSSINQRLSVRPPGHRVSDVDHGWGYERQFPLRPSARRHDHHERLLAAGRLSQKRDLTAIRRPDR